MQSHEKTNDGFRRVSTSYPISQLKIFQALPVKLGWIFGRSSGDS